MFSCSVVSDSLQPHGLQHARLLCPLPSPRACSNSQTMIHLQNVDSHVPGDYRHFSCAWKMDMISLIRKDLFCSLVDIDRGLALSNLNIYEAIIFCLIYVLSYQCKLYLKNIYIDTIISPLFPGGSDSKGSAYNGNPLQYSCLENPMDGGAW